MEEEQLDIQEVCDQIDYLEDKLVDFTRRREWNECEKIEKQISDLRKSIRIDDGYCSNWCSN